VGVDRHRRAADTFALNMPVYVIENTANPSAGGVQVSADA